MSPFVAVIGLHSSGSSAIAGVCYHLGVHMGNRLVGFYGNQPDKNCGFEAITLMQICEQAAPFPTTSFQLGPDAITRRLWAWLRDRHREAEDRHTIAGGKYPQLCRMGQMLTKLCGDQLFVVHCDRPLEVSIKSLQNRNVWRGGQPSNRPEAMEATQRWLWEGKQELLASIPADRLVHVNYDTLLDDTDRVVRQIADFIPIDIHDESIAKACRYVKPHMKHIGADNNVCQ